MLAVETWAMTPDGVRLFVRTVGTGPQVVVVPGAAWLEAELEGLASPARTLVFYDTQRRGRSTGGPDSRLTFDHEVDDLEAVRRHTGAAEVALVGWSYLGAVVALYASRHPDRVSRLALICPMAARPGPFAGMDQYRAQLARRTAAVAAERDRRRAEAEQDPSPARWRAYGLINASARMATPVAPEAVLADPWRHPQEWAPAVEHTLETLFETLGDFDWRPDMTRVGAPALVVHGAADGPIEVRREWADAFPHGRLATLADVGHFPFVERREACLALLDAFLAG